MIGNLRRFLLLACSLLPAAAHAQDTISIDANANRRPISPLIYGVSFGSSEALADLRIPLNRSGGNSAARYNWRQDARQAGKDWYFESLPVDGSVLNQHGDSFVALTKAGNSEAMLTVPMMGWVAKLGPNRDKRASFSIAKYGPQRETDAQWFPDAGNGIKLNGAPVTGNDPHDANAPFDEAAARDWIAHLSQRWGATGIRYFILDNEPGLWHDTHRDIQPRGIEARDYATRSIAYAKAIKTQAPDALIVAPEEWGWNGYRYSGFDQDYGRRNGWSRLPERNGILAGQDYLPWLLSQWKAAGAPVDIVSVHYYPQGGEYSDDTSERMQQLRNRSTRSLWDPAYVDASWINASVMLIPRLKTWINDHYRPGTPVAITEYSWGAEDSINGATAQADILGIFGREGLDMANRWVMPAATSPTYKAIKLYRNYDGRGSAFGDVSVATTAPEPDRLAAFASLRSSDNVLTVMLINKAKTAASPALRLANYASAGSLEAYQLTAQNQITRLADAAYADSRIALTLPAQSITLLVLRKGTGQ